MFAGDTGSKLEDRTPQDVEGFDAFIKRYKAGLPIERAAVDYLKGESKGDVFLRRRTRPKMSLPCPKMGMGCPFLQYGGCYVRTIEKRSIRANMLLPKYGLVTFTWGNVSGIDREKGCLLLNPAVWSMTKSAAGGYGGHGS